MVSSWYPSVPDLYHENLQANLHSELTESQLIHIFTRETALICCHFTVQILKSASILVLWLSKIYCSALYACITLNIVNYTLSYTGPL